MRLCMNGQRRTGAHPRASAVCASQEKYAHHKKSKAKQTLNQNWIGRSCVTLAETLLTEKQNVYKGFKEFVCFNSY